MIVGDYTERKRKAQSGKIVIDKIVKSTTGVEYAIGNKLPVQGWFRGWFPDSWSINYRARRLSDKKEFIFKEFAPSLENRITHRSIKKNVELFIKLMSINNCNGFCCFVGPMDSNSLIELSASGGFGYICETRDSSMFLSVDQIWRIDRYPDADIICDACLSIASSFRSLHLQGLCYAGIDESILYLNYQTGEVRITGFERNVVPSPEIIPPYFTDGFMAPEVYSMKTWDIYSDYFSMAVLFYRLLVGGFPMDGKRTRCYLVNNLKSVHEASSTIYGSEALFAFDPNDTSNEIRGLTDPFNPAMYAIQTKRWDCLPSSIRESFVNTFSSGLKYSDRHKRTNDRQWITVFSDVKKAGVKRCQCGRVSFCNMGSDNTHCIFCNRTL